MPDLWLGNSYHLPGNRVLILGESWWGDVESLNDYIPKWARDQVRDKTFTRFFNDCSGLRRENATVEQRLEWWHTIAFYNFVLGSVGGSRSDRPTPTQYQDAIEPLRRVLIRLAPAGVWIVGKGQAAYSASVVIQQAIACEVCPHPSSGVKSETARASWLALATKIHARTNIRTPT